MNAIDLYKLLSNLPGGSGGFPVILECPIDGGVGNSRYRLQTVNWNDSRKELTLISEGC